MPLSLTDRAPEVAMKTAGGAAARGDGALRRQPDGSAAESTAGHAPERTRFAAGGRKFGRWGSGLGQLFALAAGHREGVAGSASALIQSAKMRSYINYESLATAPRMPERESCPSSRCGWWRRSRSSPAPLPPQTTRHGPPVAATTGGGPSGQPARTREHCCSHHAHQ